MIRSELAFASLFVLAATVTIRSAEGGASILACGNAAGMKWKSRQALQARVNLAAWRWGLRLITTTDVVEARLQRLLKCVFNPGALPQAQS